ncbi:HAMP domain-containing histidine kinase [bacterium]|nr:HAMP domain-containing histidine kinase [bacterium]MBU1956837.1 HAMP domain-containing histidine kinase [bacterium]
MTLYNKIRIIFFVAIVLSTAFFSSYLYIQRGHHFKEHEKRYMQTVLFTLKHYRQSKANKSAVNFNDENFQYFLQESNFEKIKDTNEFEILQQAHMLHKRSLRHTEVKILRSKHRMYLFIKHPRFQLLLHDQQEATFPIEIFVAYLLSLLFLLTLYFWLTHSLKPLKTLQASITKVAKGDLSVSVKSSKKDEIAQVSNAFDDALRKLESLINSRQLFLRTIMHELKTPIGKGRLLNEFLENEIQRESYNAVFERLELLIEEFSKIEQMLSSSYKLKVASYNVQEMIDQALDLMIMDEEEIEEQVSMVQVEPFVLETDFELFSLALKNLIDNALKYSPEHKVSITIYHNRIELSNVGEQFTENLEAYAQPFYGKRKGKGNGFGLGLYIVQNIMELLKLKLEYIYRDGKNLFLIKKYK